MSCGDRDAILYQSRTGCQWHYLPHHLPPRSAAYYYFARWRYDGTDQAIHDLLRWHAREKKGRKADPSPVGLTPRAYTPASSVPADTTGQDPCKKVPGRKRCLAVDVLVLVRRRRRPGGLGAPERRLGSPYWTGSPREAGTVRKALVDQGFKSRSCPTAPPWASTCRSWRRNPADRASSPSRNAGWWSRRSASCPSTGAWSAITSTGSPVRRRACTGR